MKQYLLVSIALFLSISCSTPGKYPLPLKHRAFDSMDSFRTYFLEGRLCDAYIAFDQAVDIYARIDDICAIADAYIQRYLFNAYVKKEHLDILEKAVEFAVIGNCATEKQKISDLRSVADKVDPSIGPGEFPNNIYQSVMLRRVASVTGDRNRVQEALALDRNNGWTLFVIHDLELLRSLSTDEAEKVNIQKRIDFLSGYIQQCDE